MRKLIPTFLSLLFLACGGEPTAPRTTLPAFDFMNGPTSPGIYVVRFVNEDYGTLYGPFESTPDGRLWIVGVGMPRQCGLQNVNPPSVQRIEREARTNVIRLRQDAELTAWRWDEFLAALGPTFDDICSAVAVPSLGSGIASERSTDNDLFGQTGHNSWGWIMNGSLTFQGRSYNVLAVERFQFVEPQGFRVVHAQYRIW